MDTCDHTAWLRHVQRGDTGEVVIEDTDRLGRLIRELPRQDTQTPQLALFIGTTAKDAALKHIFNHNNIGRRGEKGNVNLRLETLSSHSDAPLLFADSSPFIRNPTERSHVLCHETIPYSASWKPGSYSLIDTLYSRLFFLFSDVICLFADDFSTQAAVASRLMAWTDIGTATSLSREMRPRLLIVISEESTVVELLRALENSSAQLSNCFSSVKVINLAGEYLSPLARYHRLRDEVNRQRKESLSTKKVHKMLFSAMHMNSFFKAAVQHTARTITEEFNFVVAARALNPVGIDYLYHLNTFMSLAKEHKPPYASVASFIASSIIMDAYPPRMHRRRLQMIVVYELICLEFPIDLVFSTLYKASCFKALEQSYNNPCTRHLCGEIGRYCSELFNQLQAGYISSSRLHWTNISRLGGSLTIFKSNTTCLYCIRRAPEQHLSCGHSVCHECIRIFGTTTPGREGRMRVPCIYNDGGHLTVDIKPRTAGVRIMSIDGGGTRGVTPLEYMKGLQELLQDYPLHEAVDISCSSSSGGLIALAKFHLHWTIERCDEMFESFAVRCFGRSKSLLGFFKSAVNYIATDAVYDEYTLECLLQEAYGANNPFFGHVPNVISGTRVAITAMTHGSRRAIFTNYNPPTDIHKEAKMDQETPYVRIRPSDVKAEPLLWQVARATSAAPMQVPLHGRDCMHDTNLDRFFKPIKLDTGDFWDGALGFPNPTELAEWEVSRLWPGTKIDVAISIGTGEAPKRPKSTNSRTRLLDCFNLLTDGEFHFSNLKARGKSDQDLIRLNTKLTHPIRLDGTDELQVQRNNVHFHPKNRHYIVQSAMALLVSNFYFELDGPLLYDLGAYYCRGTIYCRGDYQSVSTALRDIIGSSDIEFATESEVLVRAKLHQDTCSVCHRYRKRLGFTVRHPTDLITISLRIPSGTAWKISGFPQTMAWFHAQQGLDNHFGTSDHDAPGVLRCLACAQENVPKLEKRSLGSVFSGSAAKRMRR